MGNNQDKLQIIIEAQNKISGVLSDITKDMGAFQKKTNDLGSSLKKLGGIAAGVFAGGALINFLHQSVQGAAEAQEGITRLGQILNTATGATREQVEALVAQAQALELVTTASAETIVAGQAKLAGFDLQTESIQRLIPSLLDYVVAENGAAFSTETFQSYANGLGKALQGQTQQLTLSGFQFSKQQKLLLETGTETERVTALTEILSSTYAGAAEAAGNTFAGSLIIAQHRIDNMKDAIGEALMPAIQSLIGQIFDFSGGLEVNQKQIDIWGKRIYQGTNLLIMLAKAVELPIIGLRFFIKMLMEFGKVAGDVFKAVGQAIAGDWTDAWETLGDVSDKSFENINDIIDAGGKELSGLVSSFSGSMAKAFDAEGYVPMEKSAAKFGNTNKKVAEGAKKDMTEMNKAISDLAKKYRDFQADAGDALFDLDQDHTKVMADLAKDIKGVTDKMQDLNNEYANTRQNNIKDVAQAVVDNETRIAEIQKEIATGVGRKRQEELNKELAERQLAEQTNSEFIKSIQGQVDEAKRLAGLTDLQRAIEEYNSKQQLAQNDFNARMNLLNLESAEIRKKKEEENKLYAEKRAFIEQINTQITQDYLSANERNVTATKESVAKEIEYYEQLAKAIQAARSGNAAEVGRAKGQVTEIFNRRAIGGPVTAGKPYMVGENGPEMFTPAQSGRINNNPTGGQNIIINFSGAHFLGKEGVARQIGKEIVNELKLNKRIALQ